MIRYQLPLNDSRAMALARHRPGEVFARFTTADYEDVVVLDRGHRFLRRLVHFQDRLRAISYGIGHD